MKQKLSSRKFWLAIVSAILVVLNEGMELGIDNNTVMAFASLVISWIIGESVVDAARASKAKGEKIDDTDYSASDNVSE